MNTITSIEVKDKAGDHQSGLKLSASRIRRYLTCPRQYRYAYVDEIPTTLTGALAFGKVIHQVLHNLHNWSICSGEPLHLEVALSDFARLWEKAIDEQDPFFAQGEREIEDYSALASTILSQYVQSQQPGTSAKASPLEAMPLVMEFPFELSYRDESSGKEYLLCGVIDRIDQRENGLVVVDYKSGKRKPTPYGLQSDLQLILYAYAAAEIFGQPVEQVVLYHLRDGSLFSAHYDHNEFEYLFSEVLPKVAGGIEAKCFDPHYGYWCNYCDFKSLCQAENNESNGLQTNHVQVQRSSSMEGCILRSQHRAVHVLLGKIKMNEEDLRRLLKIRFGVEQLEMLTKRQAAQLLTELQRKLQREISLATVTGDKAFVTNQSNG